MLADTAVSGVARARHGCDGAGDGEADGGGGDGEADGGGGDGEADGGGGEGEAEGGGGEGGGGLGGGGDGEMVEESLRRPRPSPSPSPRMTMAATKRRAPVWRRGPLPSPPFFAALPSTSMWFCARCIATWMLGGGVRACFRRQNKSWQSQKNPRFFLRS